MSVGLVTQGVTIEGQPLLTCRQPCGMTVAWYLNCWEKIDSSLQELFNIGVHYIERDLVMKPGDGDTWWEPLFGGYMNVCKTFVGNIR